jgi:Protein of unknown function (DUF2877)
VRSAVAPRMPARASTEVAARVVATPVLEWASAAERTGSVLTISRAVTYLTFPVSVVALAFSDAPTMPNEVSLGVDLGRRVGGFGSLVRPGDRARLHRHGVDVGVLQVRWRGRTARWEPRVSAGAWSRERVRARGEAILRHVGIDATASPTEVVDAMTHEGITLARDERGRSALEALVRSIRRREPEEAGRAADGMLGLGSGLTPEGDDVLAAAAVTLVAFGPSVGVEGRRLRRLVEALIPDRRGRTTELSATLLSLAVAGRTLEPAGRLLDLDNDRGVATAIHQLSDVGHTTGRMYLTSIGVTAAALAAP